MEEAKPQTLLWAAPECPFRVTVTAPILNEIRILAVEAFYSVPRGGVEIGGVFFGVRKPDAIHIQAHRPIHCEYSTGPSFTLSVKDQLGLSGILDGTPTDPDLAGMTPLGWYHSHTRSEIFLSPVDLQLYSDFFPEKWQVALVLRPANLQPTRAGFFFRDKRGNLKSDSPVQEFNLEPPDFGLPVLDTNDAVGGPLEAPATRLPVHLPLPVVSAAAAASMPSVVLARPTAQEWPPLPPPEVSPAVVAAEARNGSVAMAAAAPDAIFQQDAPTPPSEAAPKTIEIGLPSFDYAESVAREKRKTSWIWALILVLLLGSGGITAFLKWGRVAKPGGLGLETYDVNGAFLIRWDRMSSAITRASHATLEIDDGGEKVPPIDLGPGELASGGYGYLRRAARISVHMVVDGPTPVEEYSNFKGVQVVASQPSKTREHPDGLAQALAENEHLKTELINESMQSSELRREIAKLRSQLAEDRAKINPDSLR